MPRRPLFALIVAVLLVVAPRTARSEDLSAAMLTLQDMPVGWSGGIVRPQSMPAVTRLGVETGLVAALSGGCGADEQEVGIRLAGDDAVAFANGSGTVSVVHEVLSISSEDAPAWLAGWRALTAGCAEVDASGSGIRLAPLAIGKGSADILAIRLLLDQPGVRLSVDLVLIASGNRAARLVVLGDGSDTALTERLTRLVGERLTATSVTPAGQTARPAATPPLSQRDRVRLQLKWVTQAQFAGYYAAQLQGFYAQEGLDVEILEGGPGIEPEPIVAAGGAEFGIDWLPTLLAARERGLDIVNIAQVFERSSTAEMTWKDSGITSIAGLRGKRVAVWCCGNQYELFAALRKEGINPDNPADVTIVDQPFDMELFLHRAVDAAAATTYNELAQVLETVNPQTGSLFTLDDLNVLSLEEEGTGMLQDGIFVSASWLADPRNEAIAVRFLRASFRGWIFCRDNPDICVEEVLAQGPALGRGHQRWMMNEINALIWPSSQPVGLVDHASVDRTVGIALEYGAIHGAPSAAAIRADLAMAALAGIGPEAVSRTWQKPHVEVTPGGR